MTKAATTLTYKYTPASDIMHKEVRFIKGDATVAEAIRLMDKWQVSCLVVERRDEHDAYGIVTRKDVVNKVINHAKDVHKTHVHEIFSKPLVTVSPGLDIRFCARLLTNLNFRRLVVFDGKKIVGMLSNSDIFNYEAKQLR